MENTKKVCIGDQEYEGRELTVRQVKRVMAEIEHASEPSVLDLLFPDGMPAIVVAASTGMTVQDLEEMDITPGDYARLQEAVAEVNPFFATMVGRLMDVGQKVLERNSNAPSAG